MKTLNLTHVARRPVAGLFLAAGAALILSADLTAIELSPVQLVKDINPGSAGSDAAEFATIDNVAYFRANDGEHGFELWRSDGTEAGTQLVVDLSEGASHGFPDRLAAANHGLYFNAFNTSDARGSKVWRSDGTSAGTVLLADTHPDAVGGGGPSGPPLPSGFRALNADTVLFGAIDPENYVEPWKTDGTPTGTARLKDLHPGPEGSVPVGFTVLEDVAYFAADDSVMVHDDGTATYDRELFRTDGTEAGTYRVKDINPGPAPSVPVEFVRWNNQLYFSATNDLYGAELWRTDGTGAGTVQVVDLNPGPTGSEPEQFTVADLSASGGGAALLFAAVDATHGFELFRSDGTEAGTVLIKDINPHGDSDPLSLTPFKGRVYFNADDGVHGREPWVTDGTEAGTQLFMDLNAGDGISAPMDFTVVGDVLFFVTIARGETESTVKTQLWATDGTAEATQLVYEEPGSSRGYSIRHLVAIGDQLLFTAPNGVGDDGISTDHELFSVRVGGPTALRR
jgi:ELWxxDGT repeat protein